MDFMQTIMEKIEAPLIFSSKEAYKNLSLVRDLEKVMKRFLEQLRPEIEKRGGAGFPSHTCHELISDFSAAFSRFDELTPDLKMVRMEKALTCWQKLKELVRPLSSATAVHYREVQTVHGNPSICPDIPPVIPIELSLNKLSLPLTIVRGIGPKIQRLLEMKNIKTLEDLLYFLPRRYEDRRVVKSIAQANVGCRETVLGKVTQTGLINYGKARAFELTLCDGCGVLTANWLRGNLGYLTTTFKKGDSVVVTGEINIYRSRKNMIHPDYEIMDSADADLMHFKQIIPLYSEIEGLPQKTMRRIMAQAVRDYSEHLMSPVPDHICRKRKLRDMRSAVNNIHFPPRDHDIAPYNAMRSEAHRRLIFDEFFFFQLGMAFRKKGRSLAAATAFKTAGNLPARYYGMLPYTLTSAQRRVIKEIETDLASGCAMHRLLQGDVGCGKTAVAFSAMATACENGCQAAIMAPTEILATQHFDTINRWTKKLGLEITLLTGSKGTAERKAIYEKIGEGKCDIIIGTHALIQEKVAFHNLGLVIIDEQHRFGVAQRVNLRKKGNNPHVLVMTATPIPRTLALTFYGDLDVSIIDEIPAGRKPVVTTVVRETERQWVYEKTRTEVMKGNKVFIVCPLAVESQNMDLKNATDMATHLQGEIFVQHRVGLIHGRMPDKEKERIMADFLGDKLNILVSTTVIEVGIEIPHASLMIIEHAERFGLAQLHQLRGRVGRSDISSHCILVAGLDASGDALKRLRLMEETNDGFQIAEMDLAIRGPGEFMGMRQAGLPDFRVASIVQDIGILSEAKEDAFSLVENDPRLEKKEHVSLKKVLQKRWEGRLDVVKTG